MAYGAALGGGYACSSGSDGGLIGTAGTAYTTFVPAAQPCHVTITNAGAPGGAHAKGSFTATLTGTNGAVITNGLFDTPVMAPPSAKK